jgi:hypothetical protein
MTACIPDDDRRSYLLVVIRKLGTISNLSRLRDRMHGENLTKMREIL